MALAAAASPLPEAPERAPAPPSWRWRSCFSRPSRAHKVELDLVRGGAAAVGRDSAAGREASRGSLGGRGGSSKPTALRDQRARSLALNGRTLGQGDDARAKNQRKYQQRRARAGAGHGSQPRVPP